MAIDRFEVQDIQLPDIRLSVHVGGDGPLLILLHGYPQNHACWSRVAPHLSDRHRVVVPDLRGYGESEAPPDDPDHLTYSKRRMAQDIVDLASALGHHRFAVIGHDRGARVAYRLALDHPERVTRLGIIEVVPTGDFWAAWNADLAFDAYHWTFLAQPSPLPERMISADSDAYIRWTLRSWTRTQSLDVFAPEALESYLAQARDPAHLAAMCADYRAGATIDRRLDDADRAAGRKIKAPVHFLYAESGFPARTGDPEGVWRRWADSVSSSSCRSGHFVMEEAPEAFRTTFDEFLSD